MQSHLHIPKYAYFDTITIIQINIYPLGQQIHDYAPEAKKSVVLDL